MFAQAAVRRSSVVVAALAAAACCGLAQASTAAALPAAGSAPAPGPISTIGSPCRNPITYSVQNYAPLSTVSVLNHRNGATATIQTNSNGAGSTHILTLMKQNRSVTQRIVATGTAASSNAASANIKPRIASNAAAAASTASSSVTVTVPPARVCNGGQGGNPGNPPGGKGTLPGIGHHGGSQGGNPGSQGGNPSQGSSEGSSLPFTGANIILPLLAGLILVALGALITTAARRRRARPSV
ncbi:MAG TPA: hypothetical protein VG708_06740 [Mycobacteriales bacterium]|nr:hypothetical protein [Mycobacteriales bacterium]